MIIAFVCAKCGAPLPRESTHDGFVTCAYCNTTLRILDGSAEVTKAGTPSEIIDAADREIAARKAFVVALQEKMTNGALPYDALSAAAHEHLGSIGHSDAIARVTIAMAEDFDAENDTQAAKDGASLARIAEAYLKACYELGKLGGKTEINLPFLTANPSGPKHFLRTVTPADFAALARRTPRAPEPPLPKPAPVTEPAPKKNGWWPF